MQRPHKFLTQDTGLNTERHKLSIYAELGARHGPLDPKIRPASVHHALMNALNVNVSSKPFRPDQAVVGIKISNLITRLRDVYLHGKCVTEYNIRTSQFSAA